MTGIATVQASVGVLSASANVTITNHAPTIIYAAAASPNPVAGASTVLSILGGDDGGDANLVYTWSCSGPASVTYSSNGMNASKTTTAFFTQAGVYNFTCSIRDSGGQATTSSVSVTVSQTPISLIVSPANSTVKVGQTVQCSASGVDQFGNTISGPIPCTWSDPSSDGTFNGSVFTGHYSGKDTITATDGIATGSTLLTISEGLQIVQQITPFPEYDWVFLGVSDDIWNMPLTYTWSGSGPGQIIITPSTNFGDLGYAGVVVSQAGAYTINCTVTDLAGNSITAQAATYTQPEVGSRVAVTPGYAILSNFQSANFTAALFDQYNNPMTPSGNFSWPVTGNGYVSPVTSGSWHQNAVWTPAASGEWVVAAYGTATPGVAEIYGSTAGLPSAPNITSGPVATPNPVTGTSCTVSLIDNNDPNAYSPSNPNGTLYINDTYIWQASGPAHVWFAGGANWNTYSGYATAGNGPTNVAGFSESGTYTISCTVTNAAGSTTSSNVTVNVAQTLTSIVVSPANPYVLTGKQQAFQAVAYDQFDQPMVNQPAFVWSLQPRSKQDGTIDTSSGVFTAGASTGNANVMASAGGVSASTLVQIYAEPPSLQTPASANPPVTANGLSSLSVLGQDTAGEQTLNYTWQQTSGPGTATITYTGGQNGTNASKSCAVSLPNPGIYEFEVTITNQSGLSVTSSVSVEYLANNTGNSIVISPAIATVGVGGGIQYAAEELNSLGNPVNPATSFNWSIVAGKGYITKEGVYCAGPTPGSATIKAVADGLYQTATVTITPGSAIPTELPPPGYAEDAIPTDSGSDSDGAGPASSIAVSLPSQTIQNNPGPDIAAYNPVGPSVSFERFYRGYLVQFGASVDGMSPGWTDSYAETIKSASSTNWAQLTIQYPNGGSESITPLVNGGTASFPHPAGAPYVMTGSMSGALGQWTNLKLQYANHTVETYTPSSGDPSLYLLSEITDISGNSIFINRDTAANNYRILTIKNGAARTLLNFNYTLGCLSSVQDVEAPDQAQNRQVNYSFNNSNLTAVSLISPYNSASSGLAWSYDYQVQTVSGASRYYLSQVSCPNPEAPSGMATAKTVFDGVGHVTNVLDSVNRERTYLPSIGATGVNVANADGSKTISWMQNYLPSTQAGIGTTNTLTNSTSVNYGDANNPYEPTSGTNRNGQQSAITYETYLGTSYGNIATSLDARHDLTTNSYDHSNFLPGLLTTATVTHVNSSGQSDATLGTVQYTYDGNGRVSTETKPGPGGGTVTTSMSYSGLGDILSVTAPGNNVASTLTTTYSYGTAEQVGEPLSVTDAAGDVTQFGYDERGNITQATDAIGNITYFGYNLADQQTSVVYPDGAYTDTFYEYIGGPVQSVIAYDSGGNAVREVDYTYTSEGELASVTGSTQPAYYTYDGASRLSTMMDGNSNVTTYRYDKAGNLLDERYPLADGKGFDTETYQYDQDGNVTSETDGRGVTKNYWRNDPESLVTSVYYSSYGLNSSISITPPVIFAYDPFGRRVSMVDGTGTTADTLDALGNITQRSRLLGFGPVYAGHPIPSNPTISYSYYPDNSLAGITATDPLNATGTSSFQYDAAGRMTQATMPSGEVWKHTYFANGWLKNSSSPAASVGYSYNTRGFLTGLANNGLSLSKSSLLSSYSGFSYDALGNRLGFTASLPAISYTNSQGSLVTAAPDESYTSAFNYDAARPYAKQNRDVLTQELRNSISIGQYSYDAAYNDVPVNQDNQIMSNQSVFDGQGNPTTYAGQTLTFDAENRLTGIYRNGQYPPVEQFTYDGEGHRYSKFVYYSSSNFTTTYYTYSGSTLLSEDQGYLALFYGYAADGLRSAWYTPTPNYTTYAGISTPNQTTQFDFLYDPQGNLVQRLDNTEEGVDAITGYNAYGYPIGGLGVPSPFGTLAGYVPSSIGYGGQYGYYADGNGLDLLGARYYDPGTHRFLNHDPIDYKGGTNLYAFCDGNPINNIDPLGTSDGHHSVPQSLWNKGQLSDDATTVFRRTRTGLIPYVRHGWSKEHAAYNAALKDLFNTFITKRKIDPTKMTTTQAQDFVEYVKGSKAPAIADFLEESVARHFARQAIETGEQASVRVIFTLLKSPEAKAVLRAVSKRIPDVGMAITLFMFAHDVRAEGLGPASRDTAISFADPFGTMQYNKNPTDDPNWIPQ